MLFYSSSTRAQSHCHFAWMPQDSYCWILRTRMSNRYTTQRGLQCQLCSGPAPTKSDGGDSLCVRVCSYMPPNEIAALPRSPIKQRKRRTKRKQDGPCPPPPPLHLSPPLHPSSSAWHPSTGPPIAPPAPFCYTDGRYWDRPARSPLLRRAVPRSAVLARRAILGCPPRPFAHCWPRPRRSDWTRCIAVLEPAKIACS